MSLFMPEDQMPIWETRAAGEFELSGIHVWKVLLQDWIGEEKKYYSWLSESEKTRLHRIRFESLRQRFSIAHGIVREILGSYLHQPAAAIEFDASPLGKPFLDGKSLINNPALKFNYSHSEQLLVIAISQDYESGVDVEQIKP